MKIVKEGIDPSKPTPPWWVNRQIRCGTCQCEFKLEEADAAAVKTVVNSLNGTVVEMRHHVTCPNPKCQEGLTFFNPHLNQSKECASREAFQDVKDPTDELRSWRRARMQRVCEMMDVFKKVWK